jgi:hypothetical protein
MTKARKPGFAQVLGACLLGLAAGTACSAEIDTDNARLGAAPQAIRGGTVVPGALGIVDFFVGGGADVDTADYRCTGSMIAPNVVLTAAHCNAVSATDSNVAIRYHDLDAGRRIIHVALIIISGMFTNTDYHDYKRLYGDIDGPLKASDLLQYGAGNFTYSERDENQLRQGWFDMESVDVNHIVVDNEENLNTCIGDSGGPGIKKASVPGSPDSLELVAGVLSRQQTENEETCATNEPDFPTTGGDNSALTCCTRVASTSHSSRT